MTEKMRMLCVDDNEQLRESLRQQFTAEDFEVDTAEDGDVALEKIRDNQYDIVLLDLVMKRMGGKEVLLGMRKLSKHPHVIILTGVADVPTAIECVKLGARDYVSKPYDP